MKRIPWIMLPAFMALFALLPLSALAGEAPDVVLTITESHDPVYAGAGVPVNLRYIVRLENEGDADATNIEVSVSLTLPPGVTVSETTIFNGSWSGSFPGTFSIGELIAPEGVFAGGSSTLTIDLTVWGTAGAATDAIGISATITAMDETDSEPDNDFDNQSTSIRTVATFQVSKDFSDDSTAGVEVQLTCSGGVEQAPRIVTEGPLSGLGVFDFPAGTSCTVTETVPAGYTASYAVGCTLDLIESNLGNYPCLITNTQLPVQLVVNKTFTDGNAEEVTIDLICDAGTVTADDPTASGSDPAEFTISNFPGAGTTCTASETLSAGYFQESSTCTDVAITPGGAPSCEFVNTPSRTTFAVTKEFTDGDNPTEVEVTINCFTGLPISQSQTIDETQSVAFVVTEFDNGELDCEITEEDLNGYTPTYQPGGPGTFDADGGCNFADVAAGVENTCHIVNDADFVDVEIEKLWVIEGGDADDVDTEYEFTLYCDAPIEDGEETCNSGPEYPVGENGGYQSCKEFFGDSSNVFVALVQPEYPNSHCWVEETVFDSSAEVDNDCGNLVISAGNGDSCVITNSVFFEGIPTLSQYGTAILALLMLGVGLVGFRRIV